MSGLANYPFLSLPDAEVSREAGTLRVRLRLSPREHPHLRDHFVEGKTVLVAAALVELLSQGAARLVEEHHGAPKVLVALDELSLERFLSCWPDGSINLIVEAKLEPSEWPEETRVRVAILADLVRGNGSVKKDCRHASALARFRDHPIEAPLAPTWPALREVRVAPTDFYAGLMSSRGPLFQGFAATFFLSADRNVLCGSIVQPADAEFVGGVRGPWLTNPVVHDVALQAQAFLEKLVNPGVHVPLALPAINFYATDDVESDRYEVLVRRKSGTAMNSVATVQIVDARGRIVAVYEDSKLVRRRLLEPAELRDQSQVLRRAGVNWPEPSGVSLSL
jgi:hypothetical protein